MTRLFEMKDRIFRFCSEYEKYLKYLWKFVVAFLLFVLVNANIGFAEDVSKPMVSFVLAIACSILPLGFLLFTAAGLILLHLYVLSVEVAFMALLLFLLVGLLYFRFAPHDELLFVITPILCAMGIPYILPICAGLLRKGQSTVSVAGGVVVYYFLNGIYKNVGVFQATLAGEEIEGAKMRVAAGLLLDNMELYLVLVVFMVSAFVVYTIRKMPIIHAWKIAIAVGVMIQIIGLLVGYIWFNITEKMIGMLFGNILAAAVGFALEFLFMDLDYSRTERVQFEDDEYYYFVKAVPKKMVTSSEKTITEFSGFTGFAQKMKAKKEAEDKVTRKEIADELEIDEDLLG